MIKCIYHNGDLDGKCSAAIVKKWAGDRPIELIGMNYGDSFSIEGYDETDTVIIVDFSLPAAHMRRLRRLCNLIWIDHHRTAILDMLDTDVHPEGLRREGTAACDLTWEFFFGTPLPACVRMLGSYDVWAWKDEPLKEQERIMAFQSGMRRGAWWPDDIGWEVLLEDDEFAETIIREGECILDYQQQMMDRMYNKCWKVYWKKYTWLVCNSQQCGSNFYEAHPDFNDVDGLIIFAQTGPQAYLYSLRAAGRPSDLVCGDIAKQYGGGGHPGAAGFKLDYKLRILG